MKDSKGNTALHCLMKDSKVYLKRRKKKTKHCELTVVVHYSAEVNHPPQYDGFQPA